MYYILWVCVCSLTYSACNAHVPILLSAAFRSSTVFFHIISSTARFSKKNNLQYKKLCFDFLYNFVWNISHCKKNLARYDKKKSSSLHVNYRLFFPDFKETWMFSAVLRKYIIVYENPSSGSRVFPCGQPNGPTGMTKLIVLFFRNFRHEPNNYW